MKFLVVPSWILNWLFSPIVSEEEVHERLCSESVLLIRREDVLKRLTPGIHLSQISDQHPDLRWKTLNVEGTAVFKSHSIYLLTFYVHFNADYPHRTKFTPQVLTVQKCVSYAVDM